MPLAESVARNVLLRFALVLVTCIYPSSSALLADVDRSGLRPSVLSVPSGPGSIEGLGASFESQLSTGTSSYRIPLEVPKGRAGFAPDLALRYDSGYGNGIFGLGWRIDFPFVARQNSEGQPFYTEYPDGDGIDNDKDGEIDEFDEFDTFVYRGTNELVPSADGYWRLENESEFFRFERSTPGWLATGPDGTTYAFGTRATSRVEDELGRIAFWYLDAMTDTNGNTIQFYYEQLDDSVQVYCQRIAYGQDGQMSISFAYEERPDVLTDYRPRYEIKTAFRATSIAMGERDNPVRSYRLGYAEVNDSQPLSLLCSVTHVGADGTSELLSATFEYVPYDGEAAQMQLISGAPSVDIGDPNVDMLDLNGDALPDIIDTNLQPHGYYLNRGPQPDGSIAWSPLMLMTCNLNLYLGAATTGLADMDGNVRADMLNLYGGSVQLFVVDENLEWSQESDITGATFSLADPDVKLLDANNDRFIDVMQTTGGVNLVWVSLNAEKWSEPYLAPSPDSMLRFSNGETRLADMNGDRILDLVYLADAQCYYHPGMGYGEYGERVQMLNPPDQLADNSRALTVDVNGDGMSDVVYTGNEIRVWLNLGLVPSDHSFGRFAPSFSITTPYLGALTIFRRADINGNGSTDIVVNTLDEGVRKLAYLDFSSSEQAYQLKSIGNGIGKTATVDYRSSVEDSVRDRAGGRPWPQSVPIPVPVVKKVAVSDGLASYEREFRYHDGYYDTATEQFRGFARSEEREIGDGTIPDLVKSYTYDTGIEVEALKGKILLLEAGIGPSSSSWSHYDGIDNDGDSEVDEEDELDSAAILYRESNTWATKSVAASVPGDARMIRYPYLEARTREVIEKGSGPAVSQAWQFEVDDYGNVTKKVEHGRLDAGWDDERVTVTSYSAGHESGMESWILDRVVERRVEDESGVVAANTRYYYDDAALGQVVKGNLTRVEQWLEDDHWAVTRRNQFDSFGNIVATFDALYGVEPGHMREFAYDDVYHAFLVGEVVHTGNAAVPTLMTSAEYDYRFGVVTRSTDFGGSATLFEYDGFGRLTAIARPGDSAHTEEYDYVLSHDLGAGRVINWVETRRRDGSVGDAFLTARKFYDGLGRTVMTRAEGEEPGQVVVTDTVQFNARKKAARVYLPYIESGSLDYVDPPFDTGFRRYFYDELARETRIEQPVGPEGTSYFTKSYQPFVTTAVDEEQNRSGSPHEACATRFVEDGLEDERGQGRLREVHELVKILDSGEPSATVAEWVTRYRYDLHDRLTGFTDSQGNEKSIAFDGMGRRILVDDPDSGITQYSYDDAGNLRQTHDANDQIVRYEYDGANRLVREFFGADQEAPAVEYHYDLPARPLNRGAFWRSELPGVIAQSILDDDASAFDLLDFSGDGRLDVADAVRASRVAPGRDDVSAENTLGRLAWVRESSGEQHFSYDARGRDDWQVKRIASAAGPLRNFYSAAAYDSMDRVVARVYPDGSTVTLAYNPRGLLESVPGVLDSCDYDPAGLTSRLQLACGVTTTHGYDHRLRMTSLATLRQADGLALQDYHYTLDAVSNVVGIDDYRSASVFEALATELGITPDEANEFSLTQAFTYDSLYRLTEAANPALFGTIQYRYDRIGNMIAKMADLVDPDPLMDLGVVEFGGAAGSSNRIGRAPGDPPGPHALTGTERGPTGAMLLTYDAHGNRTSGRGRILEWDAKNRPTTIQFGSTTETYLYDHRGVRTKKTVCDTAEGWTRTTDYIDANSEVRGGTLLKYVYVGRNRIACARGSVSGNDSDVTTFFLRDHLGSTNLTLASDGSVVEQCVNYPFGRSRKLSQRASSQDFAFHGFAGKERDASGLHYFEARYLAGEFGVFASVDPAATSSLEDWRDSPQQLNPYAYVQNRPLNFVDPDGEWLQYAVAGGIGFVAGVVNQGIAHLVTGKSSWQEYVGAGVGGAASGLVAVSGNVVTAGALGSAAGNATTQFLRSVTHEQRGVKWGEFVTQTAIGAALSKMPSWKRKGQGAWSHADANASTRLLNGGAKQLSAKTLGKAVASKVAEDLPSTLTEIDINALSDRAHDRLRSAKDTNSPASTTVKPE